MHYLLLKRTELIWLFKGLKYTISPLVTSYFLNSPICAWWSSKNTYFKLIFIKFGIKLNFLPIIFSDPVIRGRKNKHRNIYAGPINDFVIVTLNLLVNIFSWQNTWYMQWPNKWILAGEYRDPTTQNRVWKNFTSPC